ncbi:MAG: AI-2E family transporter [Anaerolineae bacterium]|nr:AI-2E family transporter [Anaerolineae bacterium]
MNNRDFARRVLIAAFVVGVIALFVFVVNKITTVLIIVATAWITAETLEIPVQFFMRRKIPRFAAVGLTFLLGLVAIALILIIVVPPVIEEFVNLFELSLQLPDLIAELLAGYSTFRNSLPILQTILPPTSQELPAFILGEATGTSVAAAVEQALPIITNIGAWIGTLIGQVVLYLFLTILIMLEPEIYYDALVAVIPSRYEKRAREIICMVRKNVTTWSGAIFLSVGVTSALYTLVLGAIVQLPNALALSVIAGIATIIPTIGNTLAVIPVIIVAAPLGWTKLIAAVVLYAAVGTLQDRVVTPAIMRTELDIPVAGLVIFQLTLAALIGPVGFLLAVPLLAILITLIRELYVYDTLGKQPPTPCPDEDEPEEDKSPAQE